MKLDQTKMPANACRTNSNKEMSTVVKQCQFPCSVTLINTFFQF